MFYVEFPKDEAGIDFDGGFEFEYLINEGIKVTPYSPEGTIVRVPRKIYAQMCQYARNQLPGLRSMVDSMMAEAKY
jgi:hypothetical protein